MPAISPARALFVVVTATAIAVLIGSTACTRRGGNGVSPPPTTAPITTYYVNPSTGSDSNNGSSATPFKTIRHALSVIAKSTPQPSGITVQLSAGTYSTTSGEVFPIVIPPDVIVAGNNYGAGANRGAFVRGYGEDTAVEKALGKPSHTYYATVVIPSGVSTSFDKIYVGGGGLVLPAGAQFASVDDLGSLSASQVTFGAATYNSAAAGGVLVPSATLDCTACQVGGAHFGIEAFSMPSATSAPLLVLSGPGQSIIGGGDGILSDGTANITASDQSFESRLYAYTDSLAAPTSAPTTSAFANPQGTASPSPTPSTSPAPSPGVIDFGYGSNGSLGGNTFIGSAVEMAVVLPGAVISARNDTWNPLTQFANVHGKYTAVFIFRPGTTGRNVTIAPSAFGALVDVGPAPPPTPTPSPSPSATASPTSSPT